jgi:hypothetical protein
MKNLLFLFIASCCIISCSQNGYNSISPILIGKGDLYGNGKEQIAKQCLVINTSSEWNQLLVKMNSVNLVSTGFLETNIDFSIYTVIAIFDEVRMNNGYSITINMVESDNKIIVNVQYSTTNGGSVASVITQPYKIVKINKSNKVIVFN